MTDEDAVREYFDAAAADYSPGALKPGAEAKLSVLASTDATSLLDVGCGSGRFLEAAVESGAVEDGVGVDVSRGMLPADGAGSYVQGSATALPVARDSVDAAHLDTVLHHLVGPTRAASKARARRAVAAAAEAVRPGGHLVVSEHYVESHLHPRLGSHLVFRALKHFGPVFERLHPQARAGLRASFLTRAEVLDLLDDYAPEVVAVDPTEEFRLRERLVLNARGRIHVVGTV